MFGTGFYCSAQIYGEKEAGWSVENVTDDFGEAIDNLFEARNFAAEGNHAFEGATLMVLVRHAIGEPSWEPMHEATQHALEEDTES